MQRFKVYQMTTACGDTLELRFYADKGAIKWGGWITDNSGTVNDGAKLRVSYVDLMEIRSLLNAVVRDANKK